MLLLQRPEAEVADCTECKGKLEPNVTTISRISDLPAYRPDEPNLRHAHDSSEDPEAESQNGGYAGG